MAEAPPAEPPTGSLHDELIQAGVPQREASRIAVQASLQEVIDAAFNRRLGTIWLLCSLILLVGMFGVLIWSQAVYAGHKDAPCDQPLAFMLRLIFVIAMVQGLQRDIVRNCLCYDPARDGPFEPFRVRLFRRLSILAAIGWPIAATIMLCMSRDCNSDLTEAIEVLVGYYCLLALVLVIGPAFFLTLMLCLVRRGLVRLPRSPAAAPENVIEGLPQVPFDPAVFNDEGTAGTHPSSCPVCLEAFGADRPIKRTPCGHVFHSDCLGGWLQVARSCPLCRLDLAENSAEQPPV